MPTVIEPADVPFIIRTHMWARLVTVGSTVPARLRGRLVRIIEAPIERRSGGDGDPISPRAYDYQDPNAKFLVQTVDGEPEELWVKREAFDKLSDGRVGFDKG